MKINIFKILPDQVGSLKTKLDSLKMKKIYSNVEQDGWTSSFYLSTQNEIIDIPWVEEYATIIKNELVDVKNTIYYAVDIYEKDDNSFALTYGKGHFYARSFCDPEFGLEVAKRIADESDVKQKSIKRFSGKKKKDIECYANNSKLDCESGESVDYISAAIITSKQKIFGLKSKFGASLIVSRDDLNIGNITEVLREVISVLKEAPLFNIPKTYEIKDENRIKSLNSALVNQLNNDISSLDSNTQSYDLIGTDFVFQTNDRYTLLYKRKKSKSFTELSHVTLGEFIKANNIPVDHILDINVEIKNENEKKYIKKIIELISYQVENQNIILENGKWKEFNEEYINQINTSVDSIEVLATEECFNEIQGSETSFNKSDQIKSEGYTKGDSDFSVLQIGNGYKVEAWDLSKNNVVYAVKFGTPQKLVYVCSQAITTLEIIRNNANLKKLTNPPRSYCLWLGFKKENVPNKISEIKSIILKQNIDMFARKCREIGLVPNLKFSKKITSKSSHVN